MTKKNNENLSDNLSNYNSLIQELNIAACFINPEGKIINSNPACDKSFGVKKGKLKNKNIKDLIPSKDFKKLKKIQTQPQEIKISVNKEKKQTLRIIPLPVFGNKGKYEGSLVVSENVEKEKQLETNREKRIDKLERELVFKNNLLSSLLLSTPDLIYFKDTKSRFVQVSRSLVERLGLKNSDEIMGKTDYDFFTKTHAEQAFKEEQEMIKTKKPTKGKIIKETTLDGIDRWVMTTKVPWYDENGKVIGILGITKDITEKKKLEEKLREKMKKLGEEVVFKSNLLTSLLSNIPDKIYFKDRQSRFIEVSKSKADQVGLGKEEVIGKTDFDYFTKEHAEQAYKDEQDIIKTGQPILNKIEKETHPDGRITWVSTTKLPWYDYDGKTIGTLGISRDITGMRKAEEEIYKLNALIEQSTNSILRMDLEMRINYANKATKDLFGYTFSELKGKTLEFLNAEANSEKIHREICKEVSEGKIYSGEHLNIKKDGSVFFCLMNIKPLFDEKGDIYSYMASLTDVTKERNAKEELVFRKNLLDSFLELTPDKVFFKDRDCRFVEVSKTKAKEYNLKRDAIIGKSDFAFQKEEVAEKYFEEEQEIMNKAKPLIDKEVKIQNSDGKPEWISYTKVPRYNKQGDVIGIIGISRNITGLKKIEEELRKQEELLSNTLESMEDGILVLNENFHVTYWNNSMEKITKISKGEVLNSKKTPWEIFPNLKKVKVDKMMKQAMDGEVVRKEKIQYQNKDGSKFYTSEMYLPLRNLNGQIYGIVGVVKEITKEIKTEETLEESEEKYRTLVENSQEGICIFRNDKFIFVNDHLCKILRYSKEELYAIDMWHIISEEDRSIVKEIESRREKGEEIPNVYEANVLTNDRDIRFCEFSIRKITYQGQKAYMGIIRDITEYKDMEREREKADRLESLGLLAGGIAHDFNNFLTGILGNISLAKLHLNEKEESYSILQESERAAHSARSLTQQLLTFSKGGTPLKSSVKLKDLIKNSARFVLSGSNVRCNFEFAKNIWGVKADKGQLSQAFNNLILNANQAMPEGGEIIIKGKNVKVTKEKKLPLKEGKYVMVEIRDSGTGISSEVMSKIFDPFFTTKQKGSGLGLSTVFSIIKRHEGHIIVESELEKGTSFFIYLPATEKEKEEKEAVKKKELIKGRGKVLLMDDKSFVRNTAVKALRFFGYKVEGAADGEEAIEKFKEAIEKEKPFEVVILDLTIPGGMGGEDTLKKLREIDPKIRAIVSSGYSEDPVMSEYKKHGFDAIVNKPYQYEELGEAVRKVMKQDS